MTRIPEVAPAVLSLYTGAGGFDLGLEAAGFKVVGCVENDPDARATIEKSTSWPQIATPVDDPGNILTLRPNEILDAFDLKPRELTLLAGGPPCQPFSKASLWVEGSTQRMLDPRAATLRAFLDVLEAALPSAMLLENVRGITFAPRVDKTREEAVDVLGAELDAINWRHGTNYAAQVLTIDAASYGVPQRRERVFIFASREGLTLDLPEPTHAANPGAHQVRLATCWDAIGDLDCERWEEDLVPKGRWGPLLATVPEGSNYLWHTPRGGGEPLFGWRTRYWSFLLKLAKSRPSWTIQAQPGPATGPFHWRSRRLSVREMARLQTIPDSHEISGSDLSARRQLGNAVPSAIGELLGLEIRRQLQGRRVRRSLRLIPELRDDCPRATPRKDVPEEFLESRGDYAAHPGAGRGPEALRRAERVKASMNEHDQPGIAVGAAS